MILQIHAVSCRDCPASTARTAGSYSARAQQMDPSGLAISGPTALLGLGPARIQPQGLLGLVLGLKRPSQAKPRGLIGPRIKGLGVPWAFMIRSQGATGAVLLGPRRPLGLYNSSPGRPQGFYYSTQGAPWPLLLGPRRPLGSDN